MGKEEIEGIIRFIVEKTNERLSNDKDFAKQFWASKKTVLIEITDVGKYAFRVNKKTAEEVDPSSVISPDIFIKSTDKVFMRVISGKSRPIREITKGRLVIKASIRDMVLIKKLMFNEEQTISGIMNDYKGGKL